MKLLQHIQVNLEVLVAAHETLGPCQELLVRALVDELAVGCVEGGRRQHEVCKIDNDYRARDLTRSWLWLILLRGEAGECSRAFVRHGTSVGMLYYRDAR